MEDEYGNIFESTISKGICSYCGACIAICPEGALQIGENTPKFLEEACINCKLCLKVCPMINTLETGKSRLKIFTARTLKPEIASKSQDGGVVTSLLVSAIESGLIELAYVCRGEVWLKPYPTAAASRNEINLCNFIHLVYHLFKFIIVTLQSVSQS